MQVTDRRLATIRRVVDAALASEDFSRAEISRTTGLSKQAVSEAFELLEDSDLIVSGEAIGHGVGRRALSYRFNGKSATALTIDLGGTKLDIALIDIAGQTLAKETVQTPKSGAEVVVSEIGRLSDLLFDRSGRCAGTLKSCVIGLPGVPDPTTGRVTMAPNVSGLESIDIRMALHSELDCRIILENDVNLAALGELHFGRGKEEDNFCYVNVGTGIGMGIVVNGKLIRGPRGAAGEIGFMPLGLGVDPNLKEQAGQLEAAIGSRALSEKYASATGQKLTVKDIFEKVEAGDCIARSVVEDSAGVLAQALGCIKAILDIRLFVLGGGIGRNAHFAACLQDAVRSGFGRSIAVEQTNLIGAGGLGAKVEALRTLFDELFHFHDAGQAIPDLRALIAASKPDQALEMEKEN